MYNVELLIAKLIWSAKGAKIPIKIYGKFLTIDVVKSVVLSNIDNRLDKLIIDNRTLIIDIILINNKYDLHNTVCEEKESECINFQFNHSFGLT